MIGAGRRADSASVPTAPRIAFFVPSLGGGGAERNVLRLASGMVRAGYDVIVVAARASGPNRSWVPPRARLVDLRVSRTMSALLPLAKFLRAEPPDVLVAALEEANLVALVARTLSRANVPIVVSSRSTLTEVEAHARGARARVITPWLVRRLYPRADALITVSRAAAPDLSKALGIPEHRVTPIPNPVVDDHLERLQAQPVSHAWLDRMGEKPLVVAVGRLVPEKDFWLLLRAFARARVSVPDARLAILGEGDALPSLESLCRELALTDGVLFAGFQENPYAWMRRANVVALSSRFEGLPTVVIEGLACGARIVSTNCPNGPAEILENGRWGALVPVGDADAFAAALVTAIRQGRWPAPPVDALRPYTEAPVVAAFERVVRPLIERRRRNR